MSGNGLQRSSLTFGQRVRRLRERNGQTRATVGNLVGRSAEWVKAIEAGRLKMPRLPLLLQLASVLGVNDLGELTGESGLSVPTRISPPHAAVFTVAESLTAYPLDQASTSEGGTDDLCERVRQAWRLWHHSPNQRTRIATVLPALLSDLRRASRVRDHADQRHVLSALAQTYHLTQLYLSFQPVPGLVMLAGDRAMQAAQDADDPHAIAVAAWYMSHVLRDSGQRHEARLDLTTRAAALLRPESGAEDLARWGLLQLAAALSFAREGLSEPAWRYWERANRAARALGASYVHPFLIFGQAMVDAYAVTIHTDLMRADEAVAAANRIEPASIPSATRRSFHLIEAARAHSLRRDNVAVVYLLNRSYTESPETTRFNVFAHSTVSELTASGSAVLREDTRRLAQDLGVVV